MMCAGINFAVHDVLLREGGNAGGSGLGGMSGEEAASQPKRRVPQQAPNCSFPFKFVTLDRYIWGFGRSWWGFKAGSKGEILAATSLLHNSSCGMFLLVGSEGAILRDTANWYTPEHKGWYWNDSDIKPLRMLLATHHMVGPLLPIMLPEAQDVAADRLRTGSATPGVLSSRGDLDRVLQNLSDRPAATREHAGKIGCRLQSQFKTWSAEFNEPRLDVVENATVWPNGLVVWHPTVSLSGICAPWRGTYIGRCQPPKGIPIKRVVPDSLSAAHYDTVVSIAIADSDRNIYHFLVEALPGLSLVHGKVQSRARENDAAAAVKIHVSSTNPKFVLEALAMLNISRASVVEGVVRARQLFLPPGGNCMRPALWQVLWLRQTLHRSLAIQLPTPPHDGSSSGLPGGSGRRSVIAIRRERTRAVNNWQEVLELVGTYAQKLHLEVREHVVDGKPSLLAQASMFAYAHTILAPHGAGSVFLAAAPSSDVRYIELRIPVDEWHRNSDAWITPPDGNRTIFAHGASAGGRGRSQGASFEEAPSRRGARSLPKFPWLMYLRIANLYGMHCFSLPYGPLRGVELDIVKKVLDLAGAV